jgi:hypothetical protein
MSVVTAAVNSHAAEQQKGPQIRGPLPPLHSLPPKLKRDDYHAFLFWCSEVSPAPACLVGWGDVGEARLGSSANPWGT